MSASMRSRMVPAWPPSRGCISNRAISSPKVPSTRMISCASAVCRLLSVIWYMKYRKYTKSQGVEIDDKHIEVMVRQMLHKVKIEESAIRISCRANTLILISSRRPTPRLSRKMANQQWLTDSPWYHQGFAGYGFLHVSRIVPGDYTCPD